MSWTIECKGTKDEVKSQLTGYLDQQAKNYAGTDEAADIEQSRTRLFAFIDKIQLGESARVLVKARGSHGWTEGQYYSAGVQLEVSRVSQ